MLVSFDTIKDRNVKSFDRKFIRLILPASGGSINIARRFWSYTPLLLSTRQLISERNAAPPYFHVYTRISRVVIGSTIGSFRRFARVLHLPPSPRTPLSHSRNLSILHMWSQVAGVQAGLRKKKNGEDKEGIPDGKGGWLGERKRRTGWGRRRRRVRCSRTPRANSSHGSRESAVSAATRGRTGE